MFCDNNWTVDSAGEGSSSCREQWWILMTAAGLRRLTDGVRITRIHHCSRHVAGRLVIVNVSLSRLRNRMALLPTQAFYLLINNSGLASMSLTMAQVYKDHQDEDGFLYMTYASQETFGL